MSPRGPLPNLSLLSWGSVHPSVDLLKRSGHPDSLAATVSALRACSDMPGMEEAAGTVEKLERRARLHLETLQRVGIEFDFNEGVALLPDDTRRGPKEKMVPRLIGAAFEELGGEDLDQWYSEETFDAIRKLLFALFGPDILGSLTGTRIRKAIERHVKMRL